MHVVSFGPTFLAWRNAARIQISLNRSPSDVSWEMDSLFARSDRGLFREGPEEAPAALKSGFSVPKQYIDLASYAFFHRSERKWDILYRTLWRLVHENRNLLSIPVDDDVSELTAMAKAVRRDAHKMKAFVRFRKMQGGDGQDHYVAWHEPDHPILPLVLPFFQDRFASMNWTILTPDLSAAWDRSSVVFTGGCDQSRAPKGDALEDLWGTYYSSIFNPARLKLKAMRAEMPLRYWKSMPETKLIDDLIEASADRVAGMLRAAPTDASPYLPLDPSLPNLKASLSTCRACDLCRHATQAVAGEGAESARVVLIGEQPGDQEDLSGRPFVGPAGQILDDALRAAGIDRSTLYLTNAVKHFKHKKEGQRRLHEKPSPRDVAACKPWLKAELDRIRPDVVVCLGLTAALSVFGRSLRLRDVRGSCGPSAMAKRTIVTHHPSHILRLTSPDEQERAFRELVEDLKRASSPGLLNDRFVIS